MAFSIEICKKCGHAVRDVEDTTELCYACIANERLHFYCFQWLSQHVPDMPTEEQAVNLFTRGMVMFNFDGRLRRLLLKGKRRESNQRRIHTAITGEPVDIIYSVDGW